MYRRRRWFAGGRGNGFRILKSGSDRLREPAASRDELIVLALYFGCAIALADALNVRLGVELMTALVAMAALLISRQPREFARDWWFFLAGLVLWNLSGPIAAQSPFPLHLELMLRLDEWIGFGHDPVAVVQHRFAQSGHVGILDVVTALAYNLHLPEPYIAAYFLWRMRRDVYFQFAASALVLLILGFVTFILFPAIPPWLSSRWYHTPPGVFNGFGPVLHAHPLPFHGTPIFYFFHLSGDSVAAFPSEHAAFPVLELLAFWRVLGTRAWPLLVWVGFVLFTVVYLGEHWITDALAGYVYAIAIWAAVTVMTDAPVTRSARVAGPGGTLAGATEPARSLHRGDSFARRSDFE